MTVLDLQTQANSLACQAGLRTVSLAIFLVSRCDTTVQCAHGESTVVAHVTWCRKPLLEPETGTAYPWLVCPWTCRFESNGLDVLAVYRISAFPTPNSSVRHSDACKGRVNKHARYGIVIILLSPKDYWARLKSDGQQNTEGVEVRLM